MNIEEHIKKAVSLFNSGKPSREHARVIIINHEDDIELTALLRQRQNTDGWQDIKLHCKYDGIPIRRSLDVQSGSIEVY